MKSNYKRLGDYIQLVDKRNTDLKVNRLLGINITKNFMPSVANVSETDLSRYKVIEKGQFAYSAMQVGRDETVRVVLFTDDEPAIISPAYLVFEVVDTKEVYPEFLMMWFHRPESDRYGWFISDSTVRASLEWERFCEIKLPLPDDINEQKYFVDMYQGLLNNQKTYQKSLDDLQIITNSFLDNLKNQKVKTSLGKLIELVDIRNSNNEVKKLLGINVKKEFMPSKANVANTDLGKYKIINKDQFAYSAMQVGRDETVRVVLYEKNKAAIISPAYNVFRVRDVKVVLPEFLMIWFHRPEFNRYGWFISDSSVRASLEWERFIEIKIPVPDIEIQESIVTIFHTLQTRKKINEQLKNMIQPLCPILMKGVMDKVNATVTV
ncbi:restriction endonuclease subunit S [Flavobacterium sp.]|uniref:restriction endonuclease subunit S n=1 Tax=Flavobacterium sp. TaxID=239 RepID=UPI002489D014|nr:restriction endonuclease subunit S [Flavobacterium sp.]MDI1317439.1 restriction endonuclease subunit S [Flavobacterium sp.]